jgi:hypothetical protein
LTAAQRERAAGLALWPAAPAVMRLARAQFARGALGSLIRTLSLSLLRALEDGFSLLTSLLIHGIFVCRCGGNLGDATVNAVFFVERGKSHDSGVGGARWDDKVVEDEVLRFAKDDKFYYF